MKQEKKDVKNYTFEVQEMLLNFLISDPSSFTRCQGIIKPEYWQERLRPAVRYVMEFAGEFRALPKAEQIVAETKVNVVPVGDIAPQHSEWFLKEIEQFCRHRAVETVIMEGADLVESGQYSDVESRLKDALTISLQTDLGTSYFEDPKKRIQEVLDRQDVVSTGWNALDSRLYGGFTKGTLNIFAGGSGSGKSLFLQNLALNWSFMGHDVIYFSLELSENLVAARLDSMVTGYTTKEIFKKIDDVDLRVKMQGRKSGSIMIKKLPEAGTTTNMLRAYMKEYEIKNGKKPTAVLCDYLDLMYPNNSKVNPSDMFVKDKFVAEELRAFASEFHLLFATASQLNRGSVQAAGEFDHSHIAGGISKINTADNVFGIYTTPGMKERGEYQLQFLKTRSSASVGMTIDLAYDTSSLRIADPDPDADATAPRNQNQLVNDIKSKIQGGTSFTPKTPKTSDSIQQPANQLPKANAPVVPPALPNASASRAKMLDMVRNTQSR
jgi:hypothetical protein